MKVATLDLTPELFVEFCKFCKDGPPRRIVIKENPLPDDAKVVHIASVTKDWLYVLRLFIWSASFDDVPDGHIPPELPLVVFETQYSECSEMVA